MASMDALRCPMKFEYFPDSLAEVRSDEGFEVLCTGRFEIKYREGVREMSLYCEDGSDSSGKHVVMIGRGGLSAWLPPFDKETIPESKQSEIRSRVTAAIEFMGSKSEFSLAP